MIVVLSRIRLKRLISRFTRQRNDFVALVWHLKKVTSILKSRSDIRPLLIESSGQIFIVLEDETQVLFNVIEGASELGDGQNLLFKQKHDVYDNCRDVAYSILKEVRTYIDIGANNGFSYSLLATKIGVHSVLVFEPNPIFKLHLETNLERNNANSQVTVSSVALSEEKGERNFAAYKGASAHFTDSNHLRKRRKCKKVRVSTLDEELKNRNVHAPALIKIDVEGYEIEVLRGAVKTIESLKPLIIFEINRNYLVERMKNPEEYIEFFENFEYRVRNINDSNDYLAYPREDDARLESIFLLDRTNSEFPQGIAGLK
jgi:FkbM family methyltransferase